MFAIIGVMSFVLIYGPMKSGKSLELISKVAPYEFAGRRVIYAQPKVNTRDKKVSSRLGVDVKSISVESLRAIKDNFDVIGIDEINMFMPDEAEIIEKWVKQGKAVFISGLDLDYRGKMPDIVQKILELKPDQIIQKLSVCDVCKQYRAQFTQILDDGKELLGGISNIAPEDGTYEYQARCRECFVKA